MKILVKIGDIETAVVGYGPGTKGSPMAIVPWKNKNGTYTLKAIQLEDCELLDVPKPLKQRLKKLDDKRHKRALENTKKFSANFSGLSNNSHA